MDLIEKFTQRIDSDAGYDNLSLAQDLAEIAKEYYSKQCNIGVVVGRSEQFYCFNEKNKRIDRCENQCGTCKKMKLMQ